MCRYLYPRDNAFQGTHVASHVLVLLLHLVSFRHSIRYSFCRSLFLCPLKFHEPCLLCSRTTHIAWRWRVSPQDPSWKNDCHDAYPGGVVDHVVVLHPLNPVQAVVSSLQTRREEPPLKNSANALVSGTLP